MISSLLRNPLIRTYGYWLFAIGMGTILILIEDADIEPVFSIMGFFYWSLLFYWSARWLFNQIRSILKQKKEKINLELLHLRSQVSPHFFFNTLNNLYGLIDKDNLKARQMVLTLSDMMRYSLYDGQKERVLLDDELQYLQHYIALHQARYHKTSDIQFHHHITQSGITVVPLLFIILLENAFKHGLENLRNNAFVHIRLTADANKITFHIENNCDPSTPKDTNEPGIGLKNLERRLKLAYPKRHSLTYAIAGDIYSAQLILHTT